MNSPRRNISGRGNTLGGVRKILVGIIIIALLGPTPLQFIDTYADVDMAKARIDGLKNKV